MSFKLNKIPRLIPHLIVKDPVATLQFYERAFEFQLRREPNLDEQGRIGHVEMTFGEVMLMFAREGAFGYPTKAPEPSPYFFPVMLYVFCEDVDALYDRAVEHGAVALEAPYDAFWGDRVCRLRDPDLYEWMFATEKN